MNQQDQIKTKRKKKRDKKREKKDYNPYNRRYARNYLKAVKEHEDDIKEMQEQQNLKALNDMGKKK